MLPVPYPDLCVQWSQQLHGKGVFGAHCGVVQELKRA